MQFLIECPDLAEADTYATTVAHAFEHWESVLSRFRPNSELNQLHHHPNKWQTCSPTLWDVIQTAHWAWEWSNGLIDPTIRRSLESVGYAHSFDTINNTTQREAMPLTNHSLGWQTVELDFQHQRIKLPPHIKIDLAGVAKSWAAQQALLLCPAPYAVAIDAAGDIAVRGVPSGYPAWPLDIEPLPGYEYSGTLALTQTHGMATSGIDKRTWTTSGQQQHHIIDPRTGMPSTSDIVRASVVAPTTIQADVAARMVVILGSQNALDWVNRHPQLAVFAHLRNGQTITSPNWHMHNWEMFI